MLCFWNSRNLNLFINKQKYQENLEFYLESLYSKNDRGIFGDSGKLISLDNTSI